MFEVGIEAEFEAAHQLRGNFGPATRLHGHTYRVEAIVRGESLCDDGTLCDISMLEQATNNVVSSLDYRNLDDLDVFAGQNTTAEIVAKYVFDKIARRLSGHGLSSLIVRVWESPHAYAAYEGSLN